MPIRLSTSSVKQPSAGTITGRPNDMAVITDPDVSTSWNGKTTASAAFMNTWKSSDGKNSAVRTTTRGSIRPARSTTCLL